MLLHIELASYRKAMEGKCQKNAIVYELLCILSNINSILMGVNYNVRNEPHNHNILYPINSVSLVLTGLSCHQKEGTRVAGFIV